MLIFQTVLNSPERPPLGFPQSPESGIDAIRRANQNTAAALPSANCLPAGQSIGNESQRGVYPPGAGLTTRDRIGTR